MFTEMTEGILLFSNPKWCSFSLIIWASLRVSTIGFFNPLSRNYSTQSRSRRSIFILLQFTISFIQHLASIFTFNLHLAKPKYTLIGRAESAHVDRRGRNTTVFKDYCLEQIFIHRTDQAYRLLNVKHFNESLASFVGRWSSFLLVKNKVWVLNPSWKNDG